MSLLRQALRSYSAQLEHEQGSPHPHLQLLVEIAVVDAAVPAHADCAAAHDALGGICIEAVHQQLHSQSHVTPFSYHAARKICTRCLAG